MSGWPELVSVALLGTQRRDPPVPELPGLPELGRERTPEARLLEGAGALAVYRRAGLRAGHAAVAGVAAPAESHAWAPAATVDRAELLLEGHRVLLLEWLGALAARGLVLRPESLPALLDAGAATDTLQAPIERVLGERGRWLAAQEPRWTWAAPLSLDEEERARVWATGDASQRRRLLALLRRAQPAQARALLDEGWSKEAPDDRRAFLGAIADALTAEDEPLLERALDDRREPVRTAAAQLLARLPESAFAGRMRARALPLVRVDGDRVELTLPSSVDDAALRDGVVRSAPRGTGERAWWLQQLVAATPLAAWDEIGLTPERVSTLRAVAELEPVLTAGLARAASAQRDARWATVLLDLHPRLAQLLPPEQAVAIACERARRGVLDVASHVGAPWPRALGDAVLEQLDGFLGARADGGALGLLAAHLDPELHDLVETRLAALEPRTIEARQVEHLLALLSLRRAMYEELR